jgi:TRAP-type C4-dicarboxylate transport system permease small subunit
VLRRALAGLYLGCGYLAGLFMIAMALLILVGVGGGIFGYVTRSLDEFAGYCMAASAFLGFAHAFGANEHIRVTIVLGRLRRRARRAMEIWCHSVGVALAGYLAFYSVKMAVVSWRLNDVSQGLVPVPLWFPQLGMAAGSLVFAVALADRLALILQGGPLPEDGGGGAQAVMER